MKTNLSLSNPAEVETECLVAIVLDKTEKSTGDKNKPQVSPEPPADVKGKVDQRLMSAAKKLLNSAPIFGCSRSIKSLNQTTLASSIRVATRRALAMSGV